MTAAVDLRAGSRPLTLAVAGNPNSGKSTLINAVAGSRLQVGNWPGVTVERKEASFERDGRRLRLVDLPGTYSLSPWSQEEVIAHDYLVHQRPDVVVNVVDATNLERNLYLTVQLLELGVPVVMALNVHDEAEAKGLSIDVAGLEARLGIRVVPTSATRGTGLDALLTAVLSAAGGAAPAYGPGLEEELRRLRAAPEDQDPEAAVAEARHGLAAALTRAVLRRPEAPRRDLTERIDAVVLNRSLGVPVFLFAMWLVFKLTFDLSAPFGEWIDATTNGPLKHWASALLGAVGAPDWTASLVNDGVVGGVGFVLVFVPVIFAMMFFITLLEGSGYMARAAFVMDRVMRVLGLHGKSFIPMLLGFGCNVPGIYATRTLENRRDRVLTSLLIPLMSCGARLPVYVLFAGVFFGGRAGTVVWALYVLGLVVAIGAGAILKRTLFRGDAPPFVLELPPYRMPALGSVCRQTWDKGKHFLVKAGTYILAVSVFVWFLLHMPWGVESKRDSWLGRAGQVMAPALRPLGFGTWEASAALVTGVIAKEIVVGTMGEIYAPKAEAPGAAPPLAEELKGIAIGFGGAARKAIGNLVSSVGAAPFHVDGEEDPALSPLRTALGEAFTPLTAMAFMVFVLLYVPCVVVAIAMRQEFGTWRWAGLAYLYQTGLAWTTALVVYQGGRLLGLGG